MQPFLPLVCCPLFSTFYPFGQPSFASFFHFLQPLSILFLGHLLGYTFILFHPHLQPYLSDFQPSFSLSFQPSLTYLLSFFHSPSTSLALPFSFLFSPFFSVSLGSCFYLVRRFIFKLFLSTNPIISVCLELLVSGR